MQSVKQVFFGQRTVSNKEILTGHLFCLYFGEIAISLRTCTENADDDANRPLASQMKLGH